MSEASDPRYPLSQKRIIQEVRKRPVIWDEDHPGFKSNKIKLRAWLEIADLLGAPDNVLRMKWKNLRDCYVKYLRSKESSAPELRRHAKYQWAARMAFMRPLLQGRYRRLAPLPSAAADRDYFHSDDSDSGAPDDQLPLNKYKTKKTKPAAAVATSPVVHQVTPVTSVKSLCDLTALEMYFLGHARTVSQFPRLQQLELKEKINKLILEAEYASLETAAAAPAARAEQSGVYTGDPLVAKLEVHIDDDYFENGDDE